MEHILKGTKINLCELEIWICWQFDNFANHVCQVKSCTKYFDFTPFYPSIIYCILWEDYSFISIWQVPKWITNITFYFCLLADTLPNDKIVFTQRIVNDLCLYFNFKANNDFTEILNQINSDGGGLTS